MIAPVLHETPNGWDRRILRPLMTRPRASALLVSALVLVAAACSEDGAGSSATQPAEASPSSVPTETVPSEPPTIPPSDNEPGVRVWQLPDAPDGSKPDQSWLAVGSGPDGSICVSGHDHVLNSMLYRLDPGTGHLTWVGDARTASTAADSVLTRILRRVHPPANRRARRDRPCTHVHDRPRDRLLTVLHYDADFDHIAAVPGQPTEWVVERGSID
jgi:hypothetical protein